MLYDAKTEKKLKSMGREILDSDSKWVQKKIEKTATLFAELQDDPNRIDRYIRWSGTTSDVFSEIEDTGEFGYYVRPNFETDVFSSTDTEETLELAARILAELIYHSQPSFCFSSGLNMRKATPEEALESFLVGPKGLVETVDGKGWTE